MVSDPVVDLRSDTVTRPTPEMREAMAAAEVGDDAYGEDPTVARLESLAAALLGKEAALLTPSGRMANQVALHVLARPGTEVLCPARSHVLRYEDAATAMHAGLQLRPLADDDGCLDPSAVCSALADQTHHFPAISVLVLENTHMPASGRPLSPQEIESVTTPARAATVRVHVDGARIWNAAVALDAEPAALVASADTVMFCLSKGLGAPMGSLLCGPRDLIGAAREHRNRLGGLFRQVGIVAAAGIVALETSVERLADDLVRARRLAEALADLFPGSVVPDTVRTNIVCVPSRALPDDVIERLGARGVRSGTIDARTVRFVTHRDVDDAGLALAVDALRDIARP
jgi:threonine aldolase